MQLDGTGLPYITLAQFLKFNELAESGGEAKHRVRAGGILVNGTEDLRPGRKLHAGDRVVVDGNERVVKIEPPAKPTKKPAVAWREPGQPGRSAKP